MYRVFLVDDEPWSLVALKNIIDWTQLGFVISGEADDGELALKRILNIEPDLIVSDIRMPELDGLQLLEEVRLHKLNAQVLLVSGYTDFEYARKALLYGCVGYLVKPIDEKELLQYLQKVKELLEKNEGQKSSGKETEEDVKHRYNSDKNQVKEIVSYIQEHYAENLTLQVLAKKFSMSESYISSLIKKKTEKNFGDYLMEARIRSAQKLLRETNDSIEEIALQVGYPDYFYFSKVYKRATGISPAAYRRLL